MFTTCPNCNGNLITADRNNFGIVRCWCRVGWVNEQTGLPGWMDNLQELIREDSNEKAIFDFNHGNVFDDGMRG